MPARAAIKIEGMSLFQKKLKAIDPELSKQMKLVHREAAETAKAVIIPLVPVGDTGDLVGSLRAGATLRSGYVKVGSAKVPYAGAIQFGWPAHNIAAQDFLYEGMLRAEPAVTKEYEKGLTTVLRLIGF